MLKNKTVLVCYKMLFGLLALSALVTEVAALIGQHRFIPADFFSFFTVEANAFAACVLILSAVSLARGKSVKHLAMFRGAATLYMVTTGIVFSILLSGLESSLLTAVPWDNIVLHYIMPAAVLVDWIIDPPKIGIIFKKAAIWLAYPIAYVVYSLIRGGIVGWYPYPFLNPRKNGYAAVAVVSFGIAVLVLALTWVLLKLANRGNRSLPLAQELNN